MCLKTRHKLHSCLEFRVLGEKYRKWCHLDSNTTFPDSTQWSGQDLQTRQVIYTPAVCLVSHSHNHIIHSCTIHNIYCYVFRNVFFFMCLGAFGKHLHSWSFLTLRFFTLQILSVLFHSSAVRHYGRFGDPHHGLGPETLSSACRRLMSITKFNPQVSDYKPDVLLLQSVTWVVLRQELKVWCINALKLGENSVQI